VKAALPIQAVSQDALPVALENKEGTTAADQMGRVSIGIPVIAGMKMINLGNPADARLGPVETVEIGALKTLGKTSSALITTKNPAGKILDEYSLSYDALGIPDSLTVLRRDGQRLTTPQQQPVTTATTIEERFLPKITNNPNGSTAGHALSRFGIELLDGSGKTHKFPFQNSAIAEPVADVRISAPRQIEGNDFVQITSYGPSGKLLDKSFVIYENGRPKELVTTVANGQFQESPQTMTFGTKLPVVPK